MIASVLAVLLLGEAGLYFTEDWLSHDMQHLREIPAILSFVKQGNAPRILFLGNSLTHRGVFPDVVQGAWANTNRSDARIGLVYPDDTILTDWHYVYRRFVQPSRAQPQLLVICFADKHLEDGPVHSIERLGGEFAGLAFASEALSHDVLSLSDRARYMLGATSRLWANRERIQKRILTMIPGYQELAPVINNYFRSSKQGEARAKPPTYNKLARFLDIVASDGIKVVFVATPLPERYPLPEDLHNTISRGGAELVDLQGIERTGPDDFLDGYHLAPAAAERFSKALGMTLVNNDYAHNALWGARIQDAERDSVSHLQSDPASWHDDLRLVK
ncbi:hypothetical protein [Microvirga lotononidis]|uniref:hypothetical protein n=1 Tax=Microvirga lotononidis TaxID=864069 RepID=UPI0002DFA4C5|nr:hypothetical protein [Microvirga lotononidis]WQO26854.1 hypothetical protein U0023_19655 [Microvirga lotononidis]